MSEITYNGETVPIIAPEPDWTSSVALEVRGRTNVMEALSTAEERHCLQPRPLYGLSFQTVTLSAKESAYVRRVLESAGELPIAVPVWSSELLLASAAVAGAGTLTVEDATGGIDPVRSSLFEALSGYALLWSDFETWEIVTIASFSGASITLTGTLEGDWPEGTRLYPVLVGEPRSSAVKASNDEVNSLTIAVAEAFHGLTAQGTRETYLYVETPVLVDLEGEFDLIVVNWSAVSEEAETITVSYRQYSGGWGAWADLDEIDPAETSYATGLPNTNRYQFRIKVSTCCVDSEWSSSLEWDTGVAPSAPTLSLTV